MLSKVENSIMVDECFNNLGGAVVCIIDHRQNKKCWNKQSSYKTLCQISLESKEELYRSSEIFFLGYIFFPDLNTNLDPTPMTLMIRC